jgi:hypothetical protein
MVSLCLMVSLAACAPPPLYAAATGSAPWSTDPAPETISR